MNISHDAYIDEHIKGCWVGGMTLCMLPPKIKLPFSLELSVTNINTNSLLKKICDLQFFTDILNVGCHTSSILALWIEMLLMLVLLKNYNISSGTWFCPVAPEQLAVYSKDDSHGIINNNSTGYTLYIPFIFESQTSHYFFTIALSRHNISPKRSFNSWIHYAKFKFRKNNKMTIIFPSAGRPMTDIVFFSLHLHAWCQICYQILQRLLLTAVRFSDALF